MSKRLFVALSAIVLTASANLVVAQSTSGGDRGKQSAPPQSSHAPGHDAQSGRPETAQSPGSNATTGSIDGQKKGSTGEANAAIAEEAEKQKK